MNKKWHMRLLGFSAAVILLLSTFSMPAWGQKAGAGYTPPPAGQITEQMRPWGGWPWLTAGVLTAGAVAVGAKSAKRSHLD